MYEVTYPQIRKYPTATQTHAKAETILKNLPRWYIINIVQGNNFNIVVLKCVLHIFEFRIILAGGKFEKIMLPLA